MNCSPVIVQVPNDQFPPNHHQSLVLGGDVTEDTVARPITLLQVASNASGKKRQAEPEPTELATLPALESDVGQTHPSYPSKCRKQRAVVSSS